MSSVAATAGAGTHDDSDCDSDADCGPAATSPKPMTPRRVKRRSVMQRGSSGRRSGSGGTATRASQRSSSAAHIVTRRNPVTRLMCEPPDHLPAYSSARVPAPGLLVAAGPPPPAPPHRWQLNGHANPTYQQSSTQSLNEPDELDELYHNRPPSARSSYSNFHGTRTLHPYTTRTGGGGSGGGDCTPAAQVPPHRHHPPPAYYHQQLQPPDSETAI